MLTRFVVAVFATIAAVLAPAEIAAQSSAPSRAISLSGGMLDYDLSGTGNTRLVAIRADLPVHRIALVEVGALVARPPQQGGDTITFIVPEVQAQIQYPLGRVAPYLGAGTGLAIATHEGASDTEVTFSGAAGTRVSIVDRLGARAELRVRGIGTRFSGSTAEITGGLSWRF